MAKTAARHNKRTINQSARPAWIYSQSALAARGCSKLWMARNYDCQLASYLRFWREIWHLTLIACFFTWINKRGRILWISDVINLHFFPLFWRSNGLFQCSVKRKPLQLILRHIYVTMLTVKMKYTLLDRWNWIKTIYWYV